MKHADHQIEADANKTHGRGGKHGLSWVHSQPSEPVTVLKKTDNSELDRESRRGASYSLEDRSHKTSSSGKLSAAGPDSSDIGIAFEHIDDTDDSQSDQEKRPGVVSLMQNRSHDIPTSDSAERIACSNTNDTFFQWLLNQLLRFYLDTREEICNNVSCHRYSLVFGT